MSVLRSWTHKGKIRETDLTNTLQVPRKYEMEYIIDPLRDCEDLEDLAALRTRRRLLSFGTRTCRGDDCPDIYHVFAIGRCIVPPRIQTRVIQAENL